MNIERIIDDVREGKLVIIVDDAGREDEGDLFVAAEKATPESINFMATNGRGLICMPMTKKRADELDIQLMVGKEQNTEKQQCKFCVGIDATQGTATGSSAVDRATTIRKAASQEAKPEDFRQPGHVFPLLAEEAGLFARQGHTEAAVDLARVAGLKPMGVICEILNEDGTMAHGAELEEFAAKHHLKTVQVGDIMKYRVMHEKLIEPIVDVDLPTVHGQFRLHAFRTIDGREEIALVKGDVAGKEVLVRAHSECLTGEVFGSLRCDCDEQLQTAMCAIEREGTGIIIYLRQEGRGIGLLNKLKAYKLQEHGLDTVEANKKLGFAEDGRNYWIAAKILSYFDVKSVRLLSNNPDKEDELKDLGIGVVERLPLESMPTRHNLKYLQAKHDKMGHVMDIKEKMIFI